MYNLEPGASLLVHNHDLDPLPRVLRLKSSARLRERVRRRDERLKVHELARDEAYGVGVAAGGVPDGSWVPNQY